jgi:hypothetical protein
MTKFISCKKYKKKKKYILKNRIKLKDIRQSGRTTRSMWGFSFSCPFSPGSSSDVTGGPSLTMKFPGELTTNGSDQT